MRVLLGMQEGISALHQDVKSPCREQHTVGLLASCGERPTLHHQPPHLSMPTLLAVYNPSATLPMHVQQSMFKPRNGVPHFSDCHFCSACDLEQPSKGSSSKAITSSAQLSPHMFPSDEFLGARGSLPNW